MTRARLIVAVSGENGDVVRRRVEAAIDRGADAIELRVDLMGPIDADFFRALRVATPSAVPFILTLRSAAEGGGWDGGDDDRVSRLIELGPFADYIDVELALWRRSANIRQKIGLALRRADVVSHSEGREEIEFGRRRRLILSRHDFSGRPTTLQTDLVTMLGEPQCEVPKLAWRARSVRDNFEAFELMQDSPRPIIAACMGPDGALSRIAARKFGAFGTFAALEAGQETAAGQLTIAELKRRFRWDAIDAQTALYGVIGDPVGHSISPDVHNAAFAEAGINAVYVPLPVRPGYESFKALMVEVMARPWLDFRGFSITVPHKENAIRFLNESGGAIDPPARTIGAVNTLRLDQDGSLSGFNTDAPAVVASLRTAGGSESGGSLAGRRVLILGAGGVARAAAAGLRDAGATVAVANRTTSRANDLAASLGCEAVPWEGRGSVSADAIINCTTAGMFPNDAETPFAADWLRPETVVMDVVYRPRMTRLLREAGRRGCQTLDGLGMFLLQAAGQFEIWTGRRPGPGTMERAAQESLGRD